MNKIFEREFSYGYFQVFDDKPSIANLIKIKQVHGDNISNTKECVTADGIILKKSELSFATPVIKTADCLPILYVSSEEVAIIHAGWRGLKSGIHIHQDLKNKKFDHIFIGPSISAKNFEVTEEFQDYFPRSQCFSTNSSKLTFNLQEYALIQLHECFPMAIIEATEICTFDDLKFNSYRRDKTNKRNWNIFKKKD